jgi:hypothetical protein
MPTVREVPFEVTESAAATFTTEAIVLSGHFTQQELDRGVVPVSILADIIDGVVPAAANTDNVVNIGLTRQLETEKKYCNNTKQLYTKRHNRPSGAAAGCINSDTAKEIPGVVDVDGYTLLNSLRVRQIDPKSPDDDLYIWIQAAGYGTARAAYGAIKFVIMD